MSINENFKKRKRYQENGNNEKDLLSYWTSWETVECEDQETGEKQTLENKIASMENKSKADFAGHVFNYNASEDTFGHAKSAKESPLAAKQNGSLGSHINVFAREDHVHPMGIAHSLYPAPTINGNPLFGADHKISLTTNNIPATVQNGYISRDEKDTWTENFRRLMGAVIPANNRHYELFKPESRVTGIDAFTLERCGTVKRLKLVGVKDTLQKGATTIYTLSDAESIWKPQTKYHAILPYCIDDAEVKFVRLEFDTNGIIILTTPTSIASTNHFNIDIIYL